MQYKKKRFVFYFILFTYLVIIKVFLFKLIIIYNANFRILINKFSSLNKTLFINLKLVVYFHKIKATYFNFVII